MTAGFVFIVLSIASYGVYQACLHNAEDHREHCSASGTITRVVKTDSGGTMYYIQFMNMDGIEMEGQSVYYMRTNCKYQMGDPVNISYFITKKGRARIKIDDPDLSPSSDSAITAARNMKIASIVFFIIAMISFIAYII